MNRRNLSAVLFALALGACASSPTVTTDVAPGADFSKYSTYQWATSTIPAGVDPVLGQRVRDEIDAQMAGKGYTKASPGQLAIAFSLGAKQETEIDSYGAFGLGLDVSQYTEGMLNVDAFDTATKQAVWHGQAKQILGDNPDPSKIEGVVDATMKNFPSRVPAAPAN